MILSGKVSDENAKKLGYAQGFSFRIVAGLIDSKNQENISENEPKKQDVVFAFTTNISGKENISATVLPEDIVEDLYFDCFAENQMEEIQNANRI